MTRPARIYTRTGDAGDTGLVGGQRVSKDDARIECFGSVDECSCVIGLARRALADERARERLRALDAWLAWTQDRLFNLGSDLATPAAERRGGIPRVEQGDIDALEAAIDRFTDELPPLTNFIHPGGSPAGGFLHLARSVCRRAERRIVELARKQSVEPAVLRYVNRLSDALFVWARWANQMSGSPEAVWDPSSAPPI